MLTKEHDNIFGDFEPLTEGNLKGWDEEFAHCRRVPGRRRESYI